MTKGELRAARKAARAAGQPLTGALAVNGRDEKPPVPVVRMRRNYARERYASRSEQRARYIDCGPSNWDDRQSPSGDY